MDNESYLFNLWVKTWCEKILTKYKLLEHSSNSNYEDKFNEEILNNIIKTKEIYDPYFNFSSEFLEGIDKIRKYWYLYRPCASYEKSIEGWKLYHNYTLKIISPITLMNKSTVKVKENNLIRRYCNSFVSSVKIYYKFNRPKIKVFKSNNIISYEFIKIDKDINYSFYLNKDYTDLIVLHFEKDDIDIVIDNFIPSYPIWFEENVVILTPILLQQINGCNFRNPIQSLYNRIASTIGAILLKDESIKLPIFKNEEITRGISDYEEGILKDGRVKRLIPEYTKHIPKYGHGWMAPDTQKDIISLLEVIKPKVILELGSWYGLSTRIFSNSNPIKDFTIYSIDRYENNAIHEKNIYESLEGKLFENHLRYETFCSNLSPYIDKREDLVSRYYYDKPDKNKEKEVFVLKMDIYEGVELIYKHNITPDVIFIDFEKKEKSLRNVLLKLRAYFPKAVIIGDDYEFSSVKNAIKYIASFNYIISSNNSYIITPSEDLHLQIKKRIDENLKRFSLTINQIKTQKELQRGILLNPFVKIPGQKSYAINEFVFDNKKLSVDIIKMLYENEEKDFWNWPNPIHNPASYTFFEYLLTDRIFFE